MNKEELLFCCMMKKSQAKTAAAATKGGKQISMDKAHHFLEHTNHCVTINAIKHLGWGKLKDSSQIYQPCAEAKVN